VGTVPVNAATSQAWEAASICGSGYSPDGSNAPPTTIVYVSHNGSTDCVVTMKTASVGTPSLIWASVGAYGAGIICLDQGMYKYCAGPVYAYAPHVCIYWGGGGSAQIDSGNWFGHCG
jgi:hypothetical protein